LSTWESQRDKSSVFEEVEMDWNTSVLGLYMLATAIVGVMLFKETDDAQKMRKKRKVGPVYWGCYQGTSLDEPDSMKTIDIPEPSKNPEVVVGSGMYARGRAVKSANG
jgi:hypothetical protein